MLDQVASSATNYGLLLTVAAISDAEGFGLVSILMIAHGLALGAVRAGIFEASIVQRREGEASAQGIRARWQSALGLCFAVASVLGVIATVAYWLLGGSQGALVLVVLFSLSLVPIATQDCLRYKHLSSGDSHKALVLDLTWLVCQAALTGFVIAAPGQHGPEALVTAWLCGALVSLAVGLVAERRNLSVAASVRVGPLVWRTLHRGPALLAEYFLVAGPSQGAFIVLGVLIGAAEFGQMRLALLMIGVLATALTPLRVMFIGEAMRSSAGVPALRAKAFQIGVVYGIVLAGWGVFLLLLPIGLATNVLSDVWGDARSFIILAALAESMRVASFPLVDFVKVHGSARHLVRSRMVSTSFVAIAILAGAFSGSARWALAGLFGAQALNYALWGLSSRRVLR